MAKSPSERTRQAAIKLSAETFKGEGTLLVRSVRSTVAEDGRPLHRFITHDSKDPNGGRHVAILDDDGKEVDAASLSASVTRALGAEVAIKVAPIGRPVATLAASASIDPRSNDLVLELGEVEDEIVTVTIPPRAGVTKADVYILADTTGSMGDVLAAVQAGANAILAGVPGGIDIAFGVGNYRDLPDTNPPFDHQLAPDTNAANVTAAINAWAASLGGDTPEGQLSALYRLGEAPGGAIGWRPDSKRIIVWFGDAPGHDPICDAISNDGFDITEASATARLIAQDITVLAVSTDTGTAGALDGDPTSEAFDYSPTCPIGGAAGQATRIANATGGQHVSGINPDDIVETIIDLIESAVLDIDEVKLVPTAAVAPFVESISPASYGPLPGGEEHVLPFKVRWRGVKPCGDEDVVVTGGLNAVADGTVIARKPVRITIPACPPEFVYAVKYVCGTAEDCGCPEAPVRPGRYATEINIHNPSRHTAGVAKWVTPTVSAGIGVGREPRSQSPVNRDRIKLRQHEATMDDCRRLAELHYGAPPEGKLPLTIGFLEIVSTQQLVVTAVYTATGAEGGLTMDVETVQPIVRPQLPPRGTFERVPPTTTG
jgi:hypothetical protein